MSWTHNSANKTIIARSLISPLFSDVLDSIVTPSWLICDVTRTRGISIVTSYSSIVFSRANWHKSVLHLWITTLNIDFSPPGIHGLACKNTLLHTTILSCVIDRPYQVYIVPLQPNAVACSSLWSWFVPYLRIISENLRSGLTFLWYNNMLHWFVANP